MRAKGGNGDVPGREAADGSVARLPIEIPNVILWLEAARGIETGAGAAIAVWHYQSGQNDHATHPEAEARPVLVAAAINGHPVIEFRRPAGL
jgi:hypothetical protein